MKELLKEKINQNSLEWDQWIQTFDKFIDFNPRDPEEKMFFYRDTPSYCVWESSQESIITISYRYAHAICSDGSMFCLQPSTQEKKLSIENYRLLHQESFLPLLKEFSIDDNWIYTKFSSPTKTLGYPSPYILFNIMSNSNSVLEDFRNYILTIINSYVKLSEQCLKNDIFFYSPGRLLTNNYTDKNIFYFSDKCFYSATDETLDSISDSLEGIIDGFRRAEGIIDVYKKYNNSDEKTIKNLFNEIENLKTYARTQCLNLKNVNQ